MSSEQKIRSKIASIKNTKKITKAMELVAASKMRKAQEQMQRSKPYAKKMRGMISHLAACSPEYRHPYLTTNERVDRVGLIIVSTDRGLCGGLNINLFKEILRWIQKWKEQKVEVDLCIIGQKAQHFFQRVDCNIVAVSTKIGDTPSVGDLIGAVKVMLDSYDEGKIGELHVATNEFINTMTQKPQIDRLLPIDISEDQAKETQAGHWDYIYEPEAKSLLDYVFRRYIESLVYQSVVENISCEQAARMLAMKNATDNADDLIGEFQLIYNKARQASITQEISEIVSGAEAV